MCGIIGFLAKQKRYSESLGEYVVPMMECMGDRGPDSAGLAVFSSSGSRNDAVRRYNVYAFEEALGWDEVASRFSEDFADECPGCAGRKITTHPQPKLTARTPPAKKSQIVAHNGF